MLKWNSKTFKDTRFNSRSFPATTLIQSGARVIVANANINKLKLEIAALLTILSHFTFY